MTDKIISTFKKTSSCTIMFKCDEWGNEASSETVLKPHMTTKHTQNSITPEKSRDSDLNDSINSPHLMKKKDSIQQFLHMKREQ